MSNTDTQKISLEWNEHEDGSMYAENGLFTYKLIRDEYYQVEDAIVDLPEGTRMLFNPSRSFYPRWDFAEKTDGDLEVSERSHLFTHWGTIDGNSVLWVVPMSAIHYEWNGDKEKAANYYNAVTKEINMVCDGDVWGIKAFAFDKELDACWGYVGETWAKKAVLSEYVGRTYKTEIEKILADKMADIETIKNYLNGL